MKATSLKNRRALWILGIALAAPFIFCVTHIKPAFHLQSRISVQAVETRLVADGTESNGGGGTKGGTKPTHKA